MPDIARAVRERAGENRRLTCREAFHLATDLGEEPRFVREAADRCDVRISECQLGLFGRRKAPNQESELPAPESHPEPLMLAMASLTTDRMTCAEAWNLAAHSGSDRLTTGGALERAGIHIADCQLGCF